MLLSWFLNALHLGASNIRSISLVACVKCVLPVRAFDTCSQDCSEREARPLLVRQFAAAWTTRPPSRTTSHRRVLPRVNRFQAASSRIPEPSPRQAGPSTPTWRRSLRLLRSYASPPAPPAASSSTPSTRATTKKEAHYQVSHRVLKKKLLRHITRKKKPPQPLNSKPRAKGNLRQPRPANHQE